MLSITTLAVALVGSRQQQGELVAADARRIGRLVDGLAQHLAGAAQQCVSGGVAELVVRRLQTVEIDDDDRDRKWSLALQAVELVDIEGAVVELGQHVVLAEIFQIGLGPLACRDVGQRHLDQRPIVLVTGQHRELQMKMQFVARQGVVDDLALLENLTLPEIDQLLLEMLPHLVAEHIAEAKQQGLLVGCREELERVPIDVDHADLAHAARDEFRMHIGEHAKIA